MEEMIVDLKGYQLEMFLAILEALLTIDAYAVAIRITPNGVSIKPNNASWTAEMGNLR